MNYEEALHYIHSNSWIGTKLGLHRIKSLLEDLQNPQKELKFIHIAGTNGKGSTASMIASILQEAGMTVGLYTSPFIHRFNERMQINGIPIADKELAELVEFIQPFADAMEEKPTEFDLNTAIAMEYFKRHQCDMVVLEVGLGGLLDATNIIEKPEVAVITAIGLDHTKELGDNIEAIAEAKAGIIKDNCDVVIYGRDNRVESIFKKVCKEKNARLYQPAYETLIRKQYSLEGQVFDYEKWNEITIPFLGSYQLYNAAVALKTIELLQKKGYSIEDSQVISGIKKTKWIGRFELLEKEPIFIVDGSHNPHGMKATKESLSMLFPKKKIVFIVGVMADKELSEMMPELVPFAQEFITIMPPNVRAMKPDVLAQYLETLGAKATPCQIIEEACKMAVEAAGKNGIICALGSLYSIDDICTAVKKVYHNVP